MLLIFLNSNEREIWGFKVSFIFLLRYAKETHIYPPPNYFFDLPKQCRELTHPVLSPARRLYIELDTKVALASRTTALMQKTTFDDRT